MRIYLAGAIDSIGREQASQWREQATRLCDTDFTSLKVINPMTFEDDISESDESFKIAHADRLSEIVNTDKFLIGQADALLVDGRVPGWGTSQEIYLATELHKLVVVWGIPREQAPLWLRHHTSRFETPLVGALEYLYFVAGELAR